MVLGEECARPKPHPDPYQVALEALGLAPHEAIVIEDSPSGAHCPSMHDPYVKMQCRRCLSMVLGKKLLCCAAHTEGCFPYRLEQCQRLPCMSGQCTRMHFCAAEGPGVVLGRQSNPTCCPCVLQLGMSVQ